MTDFLYIHVILIRRIIVKFVKCDWQCSNSGKVLPFLASPSSSVKHSCQQSGVPIYHTHNICKSHHPQDENESLSHTSIAEKIDEEIFEKSELNLNYFQLSILPIFAPCISENKGLFTTQNIISCTSYHALIFWQGTGKMIPDALFSGCGTYLGLQFLFKRNFLI